jgi:O-antigen ligase
MPLQQNDSSRFLQELVNLRVGDNTWDVRLNYNRFAIDMLQKYPFGIGDYASPVYVKEAYKNSMDFLSGSPLIIHNGFLSAGVTYGIAGMITFTLFMFTALLYYVRREWWSTNTGFMAVFTMLSFILFNMTNDFSSVGNQMGIFLGLLLGAAFSVNSPVGNRFLVPLQEPIRANNLGRQSYESGIAIKNT